MGEQTSHDQDVKKFSEFSISLWIRWRVTRAINFFDGANLTQNVVVKYQGWKCWDYVGIKSVNLLQISSPINFRLEGEKIVRERISIPSIIEGERNKKGYWIWEFRIEMYSSVWKGAKFEIFDLNGWKLKGQNLEETKIIGNKCSYKNAPNNKKNENRSIVKAQPINFLREKEPCVIDW